MTVAQLIAELQKMPPDWEVIYNCHYDTDGSIGEVETYQSSNGHIRQVVLSESS